MTEQISQQRPSLQNRIGHWVSERFFGCGTAQRHAAAVLTGTVIAAEFASVYFPAPIGYTLMILAAFGTLEIVFFVLNRLSKAFLRRNISGLLAPVSIFAASAVAIKHGAGEGWTWRVFLFAALIAAVVWLFVACAWSILRRGWRWGIGCTAVLSALLCGTLAVFFAADGFDDDSMEDYLALTREELPLDQITDGSLPQGPHTVAVLDYGPGESLEPAAVDLSGYMSRGESFTQLYVDAYLPYEVSEVPVRGRVWYPEGEKNCPVLFIAHGNHEITTPSYLGYEYLGRYLAGYGYVVVSVDQNACNMLSGENDARAVLLLEHIGQLLRYSENKNTPLYGVLDANNIAIAGHSRGGEMVATAYLFNGYNYYPENAVMQFDYGFHIKSLIAIAPTVNQYMPADHSVAIENVNYLLLHGASDRDVTNFMGMSQYENVSFSGAGDYIKSALYIAGANHGQFNSLWGEYDCMGMEAPLLNRESLLPEEDQQRIAQVFIKTFLDVTLRGDQSERTLLTDWEDHAALLPETVYVQCHEESGFQVIADFEEDSQVETGTLQGVKLYAGGVNWWTEELMDFAGRSAYDTHALRLRWSNGGSYIVRVPGLDMTDAALTFDICDLDSAAVEEGEYDLLDATVTLTDVHGNTVTAQLSDHALIYPVLTVRTDKLDFLFDTPTTKEAFATVSIPVEEFEAETGEIDFSKIRVIQFFFEDSGQIAMDNIGITPV